MAAIWLHPDTTRLPGFAVIDLFLNDLLHAGSEFRLYHEIQETVDKFFRWKGSAVQLKMLKSAGNIFFGHEFPGNAVLSLHDLLKCFYYGGTGKLSFTKSQL